MSSNRPWGGPPPSYYDQPDDRHCPKCNDDAYEPCEESDALEQRIADHYVDCLTCIAEPGNCDKVPEACDESEHKLCDYHRQNLSAAYSED